MSKIHIGICAFNVPDFFESTLRTLSQVTDFITVVYGRFRHFPLPYIPPPDYIEDYARLILSDNKLIQHKQRDLYLEELETGDTHFIMDSDFIISNPDGYERIHDMDSDSFSLQLINGNTQLCILAYRFRNGWTHSKGQLLQDEKGRFICRPAYKVIDVNPNILHYEHYQIRENDIDYHNAFIEYWKIVNAE